MLDIVLMWASYGAVVGVVACLISESKAFSPVRELLNFDLLYCPICLGFWIAIPILLRDGWLAYFSTVALSNLWMLVILKVYRELDSIGEDDEPQTP